MAKTKTLALTSTSQQITPVTHCKSITVSADKSVTGWESITLVVRKPTAADDAKQLGTGEPYTFWPDYPQTVFVAGVPIRGWVELPPTVSFSGVQDEQ